MSDCTHDLAERETACADGMCPLCLAARLAEAEAHAAANSIDPPALLQARLYPDMFPLLRQVQVAAEFARGISARLAGIEVPVHESKEQSFSDLDAMLTRTLTFLDSVSPAQFAGRETAEIVLRPGTPKERTLSGQAYLLSYGLPQFFFHVTGDGGSISWND